MSKKSPNKQDARSSNRKASIICLLAGLTMLSVFPLDILLPSYSSMAAEFSKEPSDIASSISVFIAFFAVAQLIVGPLSDMWGRRTVILAGLTLTLFAVIGCALAKDYETFLICRSLQAVGCSIFVLSQALIQDFFSEAKRHVIRIYLVSFSGALISLSPLLGSLLQQVYDWPGSFYLSAIIAGCLIFLLLSYSPPTKAPCNLELLDAFGSYTTILRDGHFLSYWIMSGLAFSCHFTFIIVSPLIFIENLGIDNYIFSFILLAYGLAYISGGVIAKKLSWRVTMRSQITFGFSLILVSGLAMSLSVSLGAVSVATVLVPMIICTAGTTLVRPAAVSQGMRFFSNNAGAAGAAGATVVFAIGAVTSAFVSYWDAHLYAALACLFIGLSTIGFILNWLVARKEVADV